ncbi:PREDICTED: proline dehydrogenase 1, mitochondrial [Cyphomyrmex costatus]|uniref:proline dehydrogenase 1, mitochondrial n=1 Tax=Cyphomyrmex costatus TaxID=456900 RepID=UPI0008522BB5|nr:PREDICTED: proline dehydrogenase 1, mitochondrial [Cyphomyrmex costatus]
MAFLRSVPRRCCAGKKLVKCGASPLAVVGLLENVTAATATTTAAAATATAAAVTRTPPSLRLVAQVRGYATSSSSSAATTDVKQQRQQQQSAVPRQIDPLDLKFNDPIASFKSKTTMELMRAYVVYQMCSVEYLVENNMKVMKMVKSILGEKLFTKLMKATFYGHFVAGEDEVQITPVLDRLRQFGVKPILDYSVEEDISQEEAERREIQASVSEAGDEKREGPLKKYHVEKSFADRRYKVSSARTYFYLNEASCERNMDIFIRCLEAVASASMGMGITAVKLTALGRPQLLLQLSEVIMRARQYTSDVIGGEGAVLAHHAKPDDFKKKFEEARIKDTEVQKFLQKIQSDKEGVIHLFPWSGILDENYELSETFQVPDIKTGKMVRLMSQLTSKEEEMFRNMIRRLNNIVTVADSLDVRIMIDAEQTYFQPAISRLTLEMMRKYNTKKAVVFNTYQTYLQDAFNEVKTDLEQAERQNFYFGAKLVRGAYIEQERARAAAMGYPDPTNPTFEATTESYHKTLMECLRRMKQYKDKGEDPKKIGIMVASHNEDTVRFAIEKMKEIGISPEDKVICFGQLLGMCDYITFPLGQSGYSAYKYIPYGPVKEVLPYLSRRAQENRGILKKIKKEKRLLLNEITRRIVRGKLFYKPKGNYTPV